MIEYPDGPARGGVLVFHGGAGRGEHERARIAQLAAHGFIAYAPDLFGEVFRDREHGVAVIQRLVADPAELRARAAAALAELAAHTDRIAAIGHCFGGFAALELARSGADLLAAISLHGRLATAAPVRGGVVRARVLACTGADDRFCPPEQRAAFEDEMTAAGVDWQHHIYGGAQHGFSVLGIAQPGCAYHAGADRRSRHAIAALFDEVFD